MFYSVEISGDASEKLLFCFGKYISCCLNFGFFPSFAFELINSRRVAFFQEEDFTLTASSPRNEVQYGELLVRVWFIKPLSFHIPFLPYSVSSYCFFSKKLRMVLTVDLYVVSCEMLLSYVNRDPAPAFIVCKHNLGLRLAHYQDCCVYKAVSEEPQLYMADFLMFCQRIGSLLTVVSFFLFFLFYMKF